MKYTGRHGKVEDRGLNIRTGNKHLQAGMYALLLSTLACRPVIAIGWGEFLILAVVIFVLVGPPIYKLGSG